LPPQETPVMIDDGQGIRSPVFILARVPPRPNPEEQGM
jgi:hypothetical protein